MSDTEKYFKSYPQDTETQSQADDNQEFSRPEGLWEATPLPVKESSMKEEENTIPLAAEPCLFSAEETKADINTEAPFFAEEQVLAEVQGEFQPQPQSEVQDEFQPQPQNEVQDEFQPQPQGEVQNRAFEAQGEMPKKSIYSAHSYTQGADWREPLQAPFLPSQPPFEGTEPPRQRRRSWGKRLGISLLGFLAVAIIAFSSIGVYTTFFEDRSGNQITATEEQEAPAVKQTTATSDELSVAEINSKVSPAVVGISGRSLAGQGSGTGIVMTADGYIMTNAHVVNGMNNLQVTFQDGSEHNATVVGIDTQTDLAVIKVDASGLPIAEFGNSDDLLVGESVVAIGNPLGQDFAGSVTDGIVSALDRQVDMGNGVLMQYIQTDAAINSGNSGGPLVNRQGLVIGINSAKIDNSIAQGMGFAIPINNALPVVNELIEKGYVSGRPIIGIGGEDINAITAERNGVPTGVYITNIAENSPASKTELQVEDIITSINGVEISSIAELNAEKNKHAPGDSVELGYYRLSTGKSATVTVELAEDTSGRQ